VIGNGYTCKDTADRLYRKMISHQISAIYHFKKATSLKSGIKTEALKITGYQCTNSKHSSVQDPIKILFR